MSELANGNAISLAEHWGAVQEVMSCQLKAARKQPHYGSGGDASEYDWAVWLEEYLPSRYAVIQDACVIDSQGNASDQLDVVIFDRHFTPRVWVHRGKVWVPAESVYAVVECKSVLNRDKVVAAGEKVESVRGMFRTSKAFYDNSSGKMKAAPLKRILGILLADRSEWNVPLGEPLTKVLGELTQNQRLDLACAVDAVGLAVAWDEAGTPTVKQVGGAHALIGFFSELITKLQEVGTVAAIDYDAYTDMLEWTEV